MNELLKEKLWSALWGIIMLAFYAYVIIWFVVLHPEDVYTEELRPDLPEDPCLLAEELGHPEACIKTIK